MHGKTPPPPSKISGYPVEYWLPEPEIDSIAYADYWNNETKEQNKEWNVTEHGFDEMNRYLERMGLLRQLQDCIDAAATAGFPLRGTGADLACGVLWSAPVLLKSPAVERLYGVEFSKHRLLKLGPSVLRHYEIPAEKVTLCLGSFYALKLADHSLDFVVLAEAFHHADEPDRLLAEIRRVLKPRGVALLIGEHIVPHEAVLYGRNALKYIASRSLSTRLQHLLFGRPILSEPLFPTLADLLKPDPIAGDHYYLPRQYTEMFTRSKFDFQRILTKGCPFQAFWLVQKS